MANDLILKTTAAPYLDSAGSGLIVTTGAFTMSSTLTVANGLTVTAGGLTVTAGKVALSQLPASGAATTLASSGTVSTASGFARITTAGGVTGIIIGAGTIPGQIFILQNESANTITLDATDATAKVLDSANVGTGGALAAKRSYMFVWDSVAGLWSMIAGGE